MADRKRIYIKELPPYELDLLTALAFFRGRPLATQAAAALALYLRQSENRIAAELSYYARRAGITPDELLRLIREDSATARSLVEGELIHENEPPDAYSDDD